MIQSNEKSSDIVISSATLECIEREAIVKQRISEGMVKNKTKEDETLHPAVTAITEEHEEKYEVIPNNKVEENHSDNKLSSMHKVEKGDTRSTEVSKKFVETTLDKESLKTTTPSKERDDNTYTIRFGRCPCSRCTSLQLEKLASRQKVLKDRINRNTSEMGIKKQEIKEEKTSFRFGKSQEEYKYNNNRNSKHLAPNKSALGIINSKNDESPTSGPSVSQIRFGGGSLKTFVKFGKNESSDPSGLSHK